MLVVNGSIIPVPDAQSVRISSDGPVSGVVLSPGLVDQQLYLINEGEYSIAFSHEKISHVSAESIPHHYALHLRWHADVSLWKRV